MRTYVIAIVPAAIRAAAEIALGPYRTGPGESEFGVQLVPLVGADDGNTTHYGTCANSGEVLQAAIPVLAAAFPGTAYQVVSIAGYECGRDWHGWLAGLGLKVRREAGPFTATA